MHTTPAQATCIKTARNTQFSGAIVLTLVFKHTVCRLPKPHTSVVLSICNLYHILLLQQSGSQCRLCPGDRALFTLDWCVDLWWCLPLSRTFLSLLLGWSPYCANASNLCCVDSCSRSICRLLRVVSWRLRWSSLSLQSLLCAFVNESRSLFSWLGDGAFRNWLSLVGCSPSSSDEESIENKYINCLMTDLATAVMHEIGLF